MSDVDSHDRFHDECGLLGVWNHPEAANLTYLGLYAQQHRGQEGAGVVAYDRTDSEVRAFVHRGLGLVNDVFSGFDFSRLPGRYAIGHVRYTTAGGNKLANVQPFFAEVGCGSVALAHNGNLINVDPLRESLIAQGSIFASTSDTEIIMHLIARGSRKLGPLESTLQAVQKVKGAYSLLVLFEDRMLAIRDPLGLRPLVLGKLNDSYVVASETCAFDLIGAQYVREIDPGEVLEITLSGELNRYFPFEVTKPAPCIFEYVYFARPDSVVFGRNVYAIRKRLGEELARESPVPGADFVIPVPDSGVSAALGYSQEAKIPLELGLIRNHYVGRTFIEPKQSIRDFGVKIKLNANSTVLRGKKIIAVDDSLIRGTTSRKLVTMLREAGASEVHMRISAPPTTDPCFYGIDTPEKSQLIAATRSLEEIRQFIGVDTLAYLSREGLYRAVEGGGGPARFCDACFTGSYPLGTPDDFKPKQGGLFEGGEGS